MFRFPRSAISITSQGLVSAANLSVSLALLYYAPAIDYVTFILFLNVFALLSSFQNALFISPIGVLVPRMQNLLVARTEIICFRFAVVLASFGIPLILYSLHGQFSNWKIFLLTFLSFALLAVLLQREVARNCCLVRGDLIELLKFDAIYYIIVSISIVTLIIAGRVNVTLATLSFALPAIVMFLSHPRWVVQRKVCQQNRINSIDASFWNEVAKSARWAIPGVLVTWLFSNGYWFLLKQTAGDLAVAELGATRLLFTPVGLMIQGWVIMFRPIAISLNHEGKHAQLRKIVYRTALFGIFGVTALTALVSVAVSFPNLRLPGSLKSDFTQRYILLWGVYFAIQWFRSGLTVASLTNAKGFKYVFWVGLIGCFIFYMFILLEFGRNAIESCLWGLVAAESLMVIMLFGKFTTSSKINRN